MSGMLIAGAGRGFPAFLIIAAFCLGLAPGNAAYAIECKNPNAKVYNANPKYFAPEGTIGKGLKIAINGELAKVPDIRPACLPIAVRYNNYGVLKTPSAGPWAGQFAKDSKGHAVFKTVDDGVRAWVTWIRKRTETPKSAFEIMSIYAPPDDCVGSVGTPPKCPYGINPTKKYAERVSGALKLGIHDKLDLDASTCPGRMALYAVFKEVATFEIGKDFCAGLCEIDWEMFRDALDATGAEIKLNTCADSAAAHED